jgi:hypothetical protein
LHIERRAGELAGVQGCCQRRLIDQTAAGRIDEICRRFQFCQLCRADQR